MDSRDRKPKQGTNKETVAIILAGVGGGWDQRGRRAKWGRVVGFGIWFKRKANRSEVGQEKKEWSKVTSGT